MRLNLHRYRVKQDFGAPLGRSRYERVFAFLCLRFTSVHKLVVNARGNEPELGELEAATSGSECTLARESWCLAWLLAIANATLAASDNLAACRPRATALGAPQDRSPELVVRAVATSLGSCV